MIEPAFGRFKWEDSLEEEYREAEVVDEIVGDHVFLSVRNAGVLTGAELAELAPHYIADHAANFPPSANYCYQSQGSDFAEDPRFGGVRLVQGGASVSALCQACRQKATAENKQEQRREAESHRFQLALAAPTC